MQQKNVQRNNTQSHDSKDRIRNLREKCFEDVKSIIQNQVNGGNMKLSALSKMYEEYQEKLGLEIKLSRSSKLQPKRETTKHFRKPNKLSSKSHRFARNHLQHRKIE